MVDLKPLPMDEALEYWATKTIINSKAFYALAEELRVKAFTVTGIAKADMLQAIFDDLDKALNEGTSFDKWQEGLKNIWIEKGWIGKNAHRVDNIFRTNIQTAYNVGRYKQMMEVKATRPYWQYSAVNDSRTRPNHAAQHGKVYPADHPFWGSFYPPNGYRCFPAGTKVLTPNGWLPIETISVKDTVIGGSGNPQLVKSIHCNRFNGDLVRLIFDTGVIDSTPNHRILTDRGWVKAEEICKGDILFQTTKGMFVDMGIGNINKFYSKVANCIMSIPRKLSIARKTLNSYFKFRNKNVNPFRPNGCLGYLVMHSSKFSTIVNKINCLLFGFCGFYFSHEKYRMFFHSLFFRVRHFFSNIWSSCRCCNFKFFSCNSDAFVIIFSFAKSRMISFIYKVSHYFRELFFNFFSPFGVVDPLSFYGVPSMSRGKIKMFHQPHQCSVVDFKDITYFSIGKHFFEVQTKDDLSSGAPLTFFDSIKDFKTWTGFHKNNLHVVVDKQHIPYTGNVFNLEIEEDKSFIVKGATVHNCRCSVKSLSARQVEQRGLDVLDEMPEDKPDKGFAVNPGKVAWEPDLSKYDDKLRAELEKRITL